MYLPDSFPTNMNHRRAWITANWVWESDHFPPRIDASSATSDKGDSATQQSDESRIETRNLYIQCGAHSGINCDLCIWVTLHGHGGVNRTTRTC